MNAKMTRGLLTLMGLLLLLCFLFLLGAAARGRDSFSASIVFTNAGLTPVAFSWETRGPGGLDEGRHSVDAGGWVGCRVYAWNASQVRFTVWDGELVTSASYDLAAHGSLRDLFFTRRIALEYRRPALLFKDAGE